MRVLAIGAHPDDVEFHCGGTLLRYREEGHEVVIGIATNGDLGHCEIPPDELAQIRRSESEEAAAMLGAELIWLGIRDGFLFDDEPTRLSFVEMVRRARPDVVIAHDPMDYHQDHREVAKLAFSAAFMAGIPNLKTDSPPLNDIPSLFYMDHTAGAQFQPTDYVDVTAQFEGKIAMLGCHKSQVTWLRDHDGVDMIDLMSVIARYRGLTCGVQYAEAFKEVDSWGRMKAARVLP
jgi:N-acetylglucosamine malate deacetylase 1